MQVPVGLVNAVRVYRLLAMKLVPESLVPVRLVAELR